MNIKISICDGNVEVLHDIESQLHEFASELEKSVDLQIHLQIKTYCYEAVLVEDVKSGRYYPDILLLDIDLPKDNGIEICSRLRDLGYEGRIIFITQSEEYYLEAFDVHAYHYILKDFRNNKRFEKVVKNCLQDVVEDEMEYILLNRVGETRKILLDNILYFEANRRLLKVHYREGDEKRSFECYSSIGKMENLLLGQGFIRCHRSFLVPYKAISSVTTWGNTREIQLVNKERIPLGASYAEEVKGLLNIRSKPMRPNPKIRPQVEKGK